MTLAVNVSGGSGAGTKRPLGDKPNAWAHPCVEGVLRELAGYWVRCPDCKTKRP